MLSTATINRRTTEFQAYLENNAPSNATSFWIANETRFYRRSLEELRFGVIALGVGLPLMLVYCLLFQSPAGQVNWVDMLFICIFLPGTIIGVIFMTKGICEAGSPQDSIKKIRPKI